MKLLRFLLATGRIANNEAHTVLFRERTLCCPCMLERERERMRGREFRLDPP